MTAELREITSEPRGANIVAMLEEMIELANKDELSSVAVAFVHRDGCTGQRWSHLPSIATMIGSVATLQHRLIERLTE